MTEPDIQSVQAEWFSPVQMLELDACTRCQECVSVCPIIPHGYPDGAMERIHDWQQVNRPDSLLDLIFRKNQDHSAEFEKISASLSRCTTCGICAVVCESGISTVPLWESMRGACNGLGVRQEALAEKASGIIQDRNPYRETVGSRTAWLPPGLRIEDGSETALFAGCTIAYRNSELGRATLRILAVSGVPVCMLGSDEFCCGSFLFRTGFWREYTDTIRGMIQALQRKKVKQVLVPCAGCLKTLTLDWPKIYGGKLPFQVISFPVFIRDLISRKKIRFDKSLNHTVIYHDPCHGGRHLMHQLGEDAVFDAPRDVIRSIPGVTLVEFPDNRKFQSCCGAGGGVKSGDPALAFSIAGKKLYTAGQRGADILVSSCPFCERNFTDAKENQDSHGEILDLIELVDRAMVH